ncbi:MAG: glycosyltransferase [Candidatus Woykebacteria bacterium]
MKVSVIISIYKTRKELIRKTLLSILNQTYTNLEVIIIFDGCIDEEIRYIKKVTACDSRVQFIQNSENIGLTKSLHKGLEASSGNFIARIDDGDIWRKDKIERQVEFLKENKNCVLVGTNYKCFTQSESNSIPKRYLPVSNKLIKKWLFIGKNPFLHSSIMFRSNLVNYNINASTSQDYELYTRLYFFGEMANLSDQMVDFLIDDDSISFKRDHEQFFNHLKMHYQFLDAHQKKIDRSKFISDGANLKYKFRFESYRKSYMKFMLVQVNKIGKKSLLGRVFKNILIPDILLYSIRKKYLSILDSIS